MESFHLHFAVFTVIIQRVRALFSRADMNNYFHLVYLMFKKNK